MIITIDGPSGTGKSTVAKQLSEKINFQYLDTGAMYRAVAWYIASEKIPLDDEAAIAKKLKSFSFEVSQGKEGATYFVGKTDVTTKIRDEEISQFASKISIYPLVRERLITIQKKIARKTNIVCEGRDMGTVVFPKASIKIFLTGSPEVRAKRRWQELKQKFGEQNFSLTEKEVLESQAERDAQDENRVVSPLRKAGDAYAIDTTHLNAVEVTSKILELIHLNQKHFALAAWMKPKNMHLFYRFILATTWSIFKLFYRLEIFGTKNFGIGHAIIAANHASYLDPPLVAISSPDEIVFLARESLFKSFFLGKLIRALNSYPVSGGTTDVRIFKMILQLLHQGKKVLIFPEGSRSLDGEIQPLKEGIGFLTLKSGAPIIPTYVHGTHKIWGRNRKLPRFFGKTACVFGSPIYYHEFSHLSKKEAFMAINAKLENALHSLQSWYREGRHGNPP